jgi:O-antigen/teichoic acid export membrane protein
MGVIIKESIKSSIFSYIGVIIGYVNVLWLYPYFLAADQIGLFRIIQSSAYLLATFGQFGMGSTLVKFYPKLKLEKGFIGLVLAVASFGYIAILLICLLFQTQITNYFASESYLFIEYFQVALIITYMIVLFQVLEAYCRSILEIGIPTFLRDIVVRILTSVFVLLYGFGLINFHLLTWTFVITFFSVTIVLLSYLIIKKNLVLRLNLAIIDKVNIKEILTFGAFALLGAGGTQIILQIDSIMVSGALGLDETGIYTIAFFIGTVIELPKRAISQLSLSLLSQNFKNKDMKAVKKLYEQTAINQLIIGALLLLGIWSNLSNIYHFVPNGKLYEQGFYVVLFIGLGKLSDMLFGANGEIIVMSKYYKFNVLAVLILAMMTIALNLVLIPEYGIQGAAIASFLAMFLFNLIKYLFVWIKFGLQPFTMKTLMAIGIVTVVYFGQLLIKPLDDPLLDMVMRSLIIATSYLLLIIGLKVSDEVNGLLKNLLERIQNRG